jgi:hypothetical protein
LGRLVCILLAAAGAALLGILLFLRLTLWFHLEAGGDPVLDIRAGLRIPGIRRERRFTIARDEGKVLLRTAARRAAGRFLGLVSWSQRRGLGSVLEHNAAPAAETAGTARRPDTAAILKLLPNEFPRILRALSLQSLDVHLVLGTGDAADTAIVCGLANAVGGLGIAMVSRTPGAPRRASFRAVPRWGPGAGARLRVRCIARPTLSQAIFAAWRVYRAFHQAPFGNTRPAARFTGLRKTRVRFGPARTVRQ